MRGLSFFAHGEFFAIDVSLVRQVTRNMAYTPVPAAPDEVVGIANVKGRVVTVLSLAGFFGRRAEEDIKEPASHNKKTIRAVILKPIEGIDMIAIYIDKPGGLIEIEEDKIFPPTVTIGEEEKIYISGMADIEETLYRIINIDAIIKKFKNDGLEIPAEAEDLQITTSNIKGENNDAE